MISPQSYAAAVLRRYWDGTLPVNSISLAHKLGFDVYETSNMPEGQSGFCDIENRKICIKSNEPRQRQRYSIAHEIAHIILKHGSRARLVCSSNNDAKERDANKFAAALLMPAMAMYTFVKIRGASFEELCTAFDVSQKAMSIRLSELGYV